jgi:hypothetical protein
LVDKGYRDAATEAALAERGVRVLRRLLALTAAIWHTTTPASRSCAPCSPTTIETTDHPLGINRLGEITLDAPLLHHRVGAGHGPAAPIR